MLAPVRTGGEFSRSSTSPVGNAGFPLVTAPQVNTRTKMLLQVGSNPHSSGSSFCKNLSGVRRMRHMRDAFFFHFSLIKQKRKNILESIGKPENTLTFFPDEI